ncbi:sugar-binding transcriptional regulator [Geodermatophilus sp. SYSU D01105]
MGPDELAEIVTVARRHYLDGVSRVDIARERGLSRFKVGRLLQRALETGIVRIEIHSPIDLDLDLSRRVADRHGLRRALVVVTPDDREVSGSIGRTAGELLREIVTTADVLGVGGGRSLRAMTAHLREMARCDVVQLTGMVGVVGETSTDITRAVGEVNGGQVFPIFAPIIAPDARTATALRSQESVRSAVTRYPDVSKAVVSIGGWTAETSRVYSFLSQPEREALTAAGVVGEVCTLPVDASGHVVPSLDDRRIGVSEAELRGIDDVIGVAGGTDKTEAIRAVLRAGLVSSLVTDVHVARRLLADDPAERTTSASGAGPDGARRRTEARPVDLRLAPGRTR